MAPRTVSGSMRVTPKSSDSTQRDAAHAAGSPTAMPASTRRTPPLKHQRDDALSRRAERHADADFLDALRHAVCQQAIESDAGQQQREDTETARERRQHPLLHDRARHLR